MYECARADSRAFVRNEISCVGAPAPEGDIL